MNTSLRAGLAGVLACGVLVMADAVLHAFAAHP